MNLAWRERRDEAMEHGQLGCYYIAGTLGALADILANAPVLAGRLPFFTSLPDFLPLQHFSRVSTVI